MNSIKTQLMLGGIITMGVVASGVAQTPFYSVNGSGGTGSGTAGVALTPSVSPSGSSMLTDLGGTSQFSFGNASGLSGPSIVNAATGQAGAGVLAGTLGAASSLSAFTVTMWVNLASSSTVNNYRFLEIAPGSPATTGSADGTSLFLGLNAGGGVQAYVNNVNGNSVGTDIAPASSWNNGGTLGTITANNWYFLAISYDTIGGSSLLYSGDLNDPAIVAATYSNSGSGALNLSSATSISLLDRFSGGRDFPGAIDDVNIYNGALTLGQLDAVQASQIVATPEPATMTLLGVGSLAGFLISRRRRA